jgi:transposase
MNDVSALSSEQLQQEITRLLTLIGQKEQTIQALQHQLHLFRTARFGRKSEQGVVTEQLALQFDEAAPAEEPVQEESSTNATETITYTRNKKGTGRKPLPKSLPYIEKIHDLSDTEKYCSCGCALTHIRDEITEQLDVVPQMTFRVVHIRKQYACKGCEETMRLAPLPKQPIDQSIATPGLLAAVIDTKFNRHMPLYRQQAMFAEAGISIMRNLKCLRKALWAPRCSIPSTIGKH